MKVFFNKYSWPFISKCFPFMDLTPRDGKQCLGFSNCRFPDDSLSLYLLFIESADARADCRVKCSWRFLSRQCGRLGGCPLPRGWFKGQLCIIWWHLSQVGKCSGSVSSYSFLSPSIFLSVPSAVWQVQAK